MDMDERTIRQLLEEWTRATRDDRRDDILRNHTDDVLIFDVLPPLMYDSAAVYRASWDEWHPDAQGAMQFELRDLQVTASTDVAFAYGLLECGGTLPDGRSFRDTVRATFCLRKVGGGWKVSHQHISKPFSKA